ncbi:hypothetical protein ACQ4PT_057383 [Festuca glaucescens]
MKLQIQWPLPLSLLEEITDGFSDKQEIGKGAFAVVYKGKLQNRNVAVKRISNTYMYEKEFRPEVECLMMAKRKNVMRFLGYCADTQGTMARHEAKFVMADVQQRLLCFEYLPKGSLHEYITDTSREPRWRDCYQIITGICQGLPYLHQKNIVHFDLKPANILLDDNLVAKIADFGLSRCFIGETESRVISKIGGTLGYLAPESFNRHTQVTYQHSYRLDIYSLGVIIMEILTKEEYHVVDNVVESWSNMLENSLRDEELEQVRVCAKIGIECTNLNPAKRPDTQHIINRLDEAEHALNELHQGMPNSPGDTSLKENDTAVTVTGTSPCNSIWENTTNLDMLYETIHCLNPDIRRCFEFCSIFPRGSKLRRDELVCLWIAEEFVKTSCATEDMEDIAQGYIQELVSRSFLQPSGTSYDTDCFTIHDVMHDILDQVAGNCFRIENPMSHRGQGWEGDVPRHIQHLFIQNYDGELITETIIGLEYLRTLIVYVVGKDKPIEEEVIESICKRLPKLRVLAITFSQKHDPIKQHTEFSFPESVGQLKYLRYLAFRTNKFGKITLPSTLNKLKHIQHLDFGDGHILEINFVELVDLRHILCSGLLKLPYVGNLISLQTLPGFRVSNEPGCELKQLRDLNKLRGKLLIRGLENVKSKEEALQANLAAKRLTQLVVQWGNPDATRCSPEVEADVLEGMCPPVGLQMLDLQNFEGRSWDALPDNMEHLTSLEKLVIFRCMNIQSLPTLPQSLEEFTASWCNHEFLESCQTVGHPNWQKIEHIPKKMIRFTNLLEGLLGCDIM